MRNEISFIIFSSLLPWEGNGTPLQYSFAWKIPWTEAPGWLRSMGSLRVGHNWVTSLSLFTFMHWRRKWPPTPVFLPGESQGRGSLVGCRLWGHTESDTTERLSSSSFTFTALTNHIFTSYCFTFNSIAANIFYCLFISYSSFSFGIYSSPVSILVFFLVSHPVKLQ